MTYGQAIKLASTEGLDYEAWWNLRQGHRSVGTSQLAGILGLSPYGGGYTEWLELTGRWHPPQSDEMARGRLLEPALREVASGVLGLQVRPVPWLLGHPTCPILSTSLDGWANALERPVELKVVHEQLRGDWRAMVASGGDPRPVLGTPIAASWVQVQGQVACVSSDVGYLVGLVGGDAQSRLALGLAVSPGDVYAIEVGRDDAFIGRTLDRLEAWWDRHIELDTAPEPSALDLDAIRSLYSESSGETVELPGLLGAVRRYQEHRQTEKEARMLKAAAAAQIRAAMGEAEVAHVGPWKLTCREGKRGRTLRVP